MKKVTDSSSISCQVLPVLSRCQHPEKAAPVHKVTATRRDVVEYESVSDFVYKKMTFAGMVDRNLVLNEKDLRVLKRLVNDELAELKKKK